MNTNSQFTSRDGAIYLNLDDENSICVCKSFGPTPETVVDSGLKVAPYPDIHTPFTITEAAQGTMLKVFMIQKSFADGDEWFTFGDYAVYMATAKNIRGWECRWMSKKNFGELFLECVPLESLKKLNPMFAYTFFLRHRDNDILESLKENYVHLCCIYDTQWDRFIPPTDDKYEIPEGVRKPVTFVEYAGIPEAGLDESAALVMEGGEGESVEDGHPLLITFYCVDHLVSLKYITISDHRVLAIRTLDNDKYHAWCTAKWLRMPGLDEYSLFYGIDDRWARQYERGLQNFQSALVDRYNGRYRKISKRIYQAGIEDLINNREKYSLDTFLEEGVRRLQSSAKNRTKRHGVVQEFFEEYMC